MSTKRSHRRGERHNVKRVFPEYRYDKKDLNSQQPDAIREARSVEAEIKGPIGWGKEIQKAIKYGV